MSHKAGIATRGERFSLIRVNLCPLSFVEEYVDAIGWTFVSREEPSGGTGLIRACRPLALRRSGGRLAWVVSPLHTDIFGIMRKIS